MVRIASSTDSSGRNVSTASAAGWSMESVGRRPPAQYTTCAGRRSSVCMVSGSAASPTTTRHLPATTRGAGAGRRVSTTVRLPSSAAASAIRDPRNPPPMTRTRSAAVSSRDTEAPPAGSGSPLAISWSVSDAFVRAVPGSRPAESINSAARVRSLVRAGCAVMRELDGEPRPIVCPPRGGWDEPKRVFSARADCPGGAGRDRGGYAHDLTSCSGDPRWRVARVAPTTRPAASSALSVARRWRACAPPAPRR